jgi:multidrug transporter EmrE-like cation transporter
MRSATSASRNRARGSIVAWIHVLAAGLLELVWAVSLKHTDWLTRLWPSVVTVVTLAGSLFLLALAVLLIVSRVGLRLTSGPA